MSNPETTRCWRHKARGSVYEEIGRAVLQTNRKPGDDADLVIYRGPTGLLSYNDSRGLEWGVFMLRLRVAVCQPSGNREGARKAGATPMPDNKTTLHGDGWTAVPMEGQAAHALGHAPSFPIIISLRFHGEEDIFLHADGSWTGDAEALRKALRESKGGEGLKDVVLWLVLREIERDSGKGVVTNDQ